VSQKEAKLIARRMIHDGRVVHLSLDRVALPNGRTVELEHIQHQGAVAVVPVDGDGNVLLIRQYRWSAGGYIIEVPAGKLDPGESPETCAVRELEEETGYRPGALTPLGWIFTTPGFTDEKIWLYLATELQEGTQDLQQDEVLTVERVPLAEAIGRAASGAIHDGKSVCALLRAAHLLESLAARGQRST